jgi:NAD(P)-dependent dehydrogenase (short-subunit alcohol dehydrogenase family)
MTGKVIIVTGASRGLGAVAARLAAGLGAAVVLNGRDLEALNQVARSVQPPAGPVLVVPGDISRLETCQEIVRQTATSLGRIDGLVNNAGIVEPIALLAESDPAGWQRNLAVNVLAPMMLAQVALPFLRASHGRVINVSSGAAVNPVAGWGAYCASKAALNQFNRVLAVEEPDVTAVAFRPGVVDTEMQAAIRQYGETGMPAEEHSRFVGYYESGQLLPPEKPGLALAVLALYAPHEWSGQFVTWDAPEVQSLVQEVIGQ